MEELADPREHLRDDLLLLFVLSAFEVCIKDRKTSSSTIILASSYPSALLTMSSGPPVAKVYKISNTWQQGLYLSSENLLGGPITGNRSAIGGIQAVRLDHVYYILAADRRHAVATRLRR
jgi:hypothetical protein